MKKTLFTLFIFASSLSAQVQLGKNVQIGAGAASGTVTQVDTDATSGISGGPITTTGTIACEQGSASQFGCVKADGTTITASGGVLSATGTGGSGVQYNPTTTAYFVISTSAIYDDNDGHSATIGVPSSVTCVHTTTSTCTVAFASAHGLSVGGAIDMTSLASWPASPAGAVQQSAQYGSFQVTTVPDSTHITFTTPTTLTYTCSPCTGNTYDASLWAIWEFAKQPFIYGHGTVYGIETSTQSAAANLATWLSGISGTPLFVIDQTGQNDFLAGRTVAQVETDHQTVWAVVHTSGGKVIQTSLIPAAYGLTGQTTKPAEVNEFFWENQGATTTTLANGQYIDMYADTATAYLRAGAVSPVPTVNPIFGNVLNQKMSTQSSIPVQPPNNFSYSISSIGGDSIPAQFIGVRQLGFYDNGGTWTQMYDWNPTTGTGISWNVPVSLTTLPSKSCIGTDSNGTIIDASATCSGGTGLSGMTAGQVPIAATATTVTSSKAILGTDTSLVSGTGTFTALTIAIGTANGGITNATAIPNGITATTQSAADNSTKVATTAYVDAAVSGGSRQWSCQPGLGDGLNAVTAGTYLQSTCKNTTGSTVTLTGLQCFTDNSGSSTMNAAGNTLGALLTGAVTCTSSFAAGTQSANVALTNGDYIKFTFVADGTSKQATWVVTGTY